MIKDDGPARTAHGSAAGRLGLVVLVVVVLLAGVGGTLYGAAHLVAWAAALPDGGRPVPVRAVVVGVVSAGVTGLCFRAIRRRGDDEDADG